MLRYVTLRYEYPCALACRSTRRSVCPSRPIPSWPSPSGLKWLPFGGLFITGGLTPKNIDRIAGPESVFMAAFRDKGRVSPFLAKVPLYAVLVEDLGERGAHWVAVKVLHYGSTVTVTVTVTKKTNERTAATQ